MKHTAFSKNRLAATISVLLGAMAVNSATLQAQEVPAEEDNLDTIEIIQVKGIRGSLARSQDLKRSSSGVMDAISAEEMGKFPDTNLAESLQRITGVTISRNNNEGSQITVRGFGPEFNLLTLNGRQMPGTGNTRSFDFSNLSSEGVSALEVYKSSKVDVPTGGLGATVNIVTAKPLSKPGLQYSFSAKGIYDESNELGDDVTPEIAGLYSQTFNDNKFGVSLSASHQRRDFRQESANIPGWQANTAAMTSATSVFDPRPDAADEAADTAGGSVRDGKVGNTFFPRQISYDVNDLRRERTNAHLTLQYAPTDTMTFTADYMYSHARTANEGFGFGIWFNFGGNVSAYELDENGTAVRFTEIQNDFAHSRTANTTEVEQDSIGFNWEWQLHEDFSLEVDYHSSAVDTDNGKDRGIPAASLLIIGPNNIQSKTYDFTSGQIPNFTMTWPNGAREAQAGDIDPLFAQFTRGIGRSEVEQLQLHSEWINPNDSFLTNVKFGVAHTEQTFSGRSGFSGNQGPNGYNGNQAIFPDSMFTRTETGDLLDQFAGGGGALTTNYYFNWNLAEALSRLAAFFPDFSFDPFNENAQIGQNSVVEETLSAYLTGKMYFEVRDIPIDVNLGLRYEQTDTTSSNLQRAEDFIVWSNPTEWQMRFNTSGDTFVSGAGDYSVVLPAIDLRAEVQEDMFVRASWGKTISRSALGGLVAGRGLSPNPRPGGRTGFAGNPGLEPFESTNLDLTWEWYYDETSYAAVGYFRKDVKNFISNGLSVVTFDGLRDPSQGPRAQAAEAQLLAEGIQPTVTAVWERIIANGGGVNDPCCQQQIVRQNPDDPLMEWQVTQPLNNPDEQTVDGFEVAVQHTFGETGFGVMFNATIVNSDSEFDVQSLAVQAPLTGVSDSANFQVFWENEDWSVRVTHAWRDSYLLGVGQAQGSADAPPQFIAETNIVDFSVNYNYTENLNVFLEGYNVTNEVEEGFGRFRNQFLFGRQYGPRFALGVRYTFE